jgi:hypothetical protein
VEEYTASIFRVTSSLKVETGGTPKQWNNLNAAARAGRILFKEVFKRLLCTFNFHFYTVSFLISRMSCHYKREQIEAK